MVSEESAAAPDFAALLQAALAGLGHLGAAPGPPESAPGSPSPGQVPTTCGVCPLCLAIAAISRTHPQVLTHLTEAAAALAAAAACLTHPPAESSGPGGAGDREPPAASRTTSSKADGVQHIDVDG